jgi:hypothetical protein
MDRVGERKDDGARCVLRHLTDDFRGKSALKKSELDDEYRIYI